MARVVKTKARAAVKTSTSKPGSKPKPKGRKPPARAKSARPRVPSVAKKAVATVASEKAKPAAKPVRRPKPKFDRKMLASIKTSLIEMQTELQHELEEIEEAAFNVSQSEMSGEVGYDEDYADAGSFTFEREKDLSIANNVQDLLEKISRSLEKIDDGTYGICESCGLPIEAPRLKALPHALLCVKCKTAEERR
jgi:RNA polymerase-binding protein DksA